MIVSFTASNKYFYFIFLLSRFCQVYQGFQVTQISVLTDIKWKSILWLGGVAIVLNMDRRRSQVDNFKGEGTKLYVSQKSAETPKLCLRHYVNMASKPTKT